MKQQMKRCIVHQTWAGLFDSFVPVPLNLSAAPPPTPTSQFLFRSRIGAYLFSSTWDDAR